MDQIHMNGLEILEKKWKEGCLVQDQPAHLNLSITQIAPNVVTGKVCAEQFYLKPSGEVSASFTTDVLTFINDCVAQTALKIGFSQQHADITIKFCQAIPANTHLLCEAKIVHVGRTTIVSEAMIADLKGEIYAYASSTHKIFKVEQQKVA